MNLHALVRSPINAVNRDINAQFLRSIGYVTDAAGKRVPTFKNATPVKIQSQMCSGRDLHTLALMDATGLNIQGVLRTVYMYGDTQGVVRPNSKGGDLLRFRLIPTAPVQDWLVVWVQETWPDWCRVVVCLQQ